MDEVTFVRRVSTRTPSPSKVLSVGWWILVSTTVVSTRIRRPVAQIEAAGVDGCTEASIM